MNLANCSVQIYLIDRLLDGEFTTYGLQVLAFAMLDDEERHDPMVRIFPKVTKYYKSSPLHYGNIFEDISPVYDTGELSIPFLQFVKCIRYRGIL